ncbi:MAG: hypothetical protein ABIT47_03640 [Candidatus Paceibacterota bacterium]
MGKPKDKDARKGRTDSQGSGLSRYARNEQLRKQGLHFQFVDKCEMVHELQPPKLRQIPVKPFEYPEKLVKAGAKPNRIPHRTQIMVTDVLREKRCAFAVTRDGDQVFLPLWNLGNLKAFKEEEICLGFRFDCMVGPDTRGRGLRVTEVYSATPPE